MNNNQGLFEYLLSLFDRIQIISIISSILFLVFVIELIRKKKLKEAYALLWLIFAFIFLFFSMWKTGMDYFAKLVGIYYPPAFLFLILITAIIMILIQFSVIVSDQNEKIKKLTQEIALLKHQLQNRPDSSKENEN
jgi:hypothetical protein